VILSYIDLYNFKHISPSYGERGQFYITEYFSAAEKKEKRVFHGVTP